MLVLFSGLLLLTNTFLGSLYKRIHLETDTGQRSDRIEWGHARYQTVFRPDQAYELVVEWLTSSGSIIAELVCSLFICNIIGT